MHKSDPAFGYCQGILLARSKSGVIKPQKVIVEVMKLKNKQHIKCRFRKLPAPSRIPVFIKPNQTRKQSNSKALVPASKLTYVQKVFSQEARFRRMANFLAPQIVCYMFEENRTNSTSGKNASAVEVARRDMSSQTKFANIDKPYFGKDDAVDEQQDDEEDVLEEDEDEQLEDMTTQPSKHESEDAGKEYLHCGLRRLRPKESRLFLLAPDYEEPLSPTSDAGDGPPPVLTDIKADEIPTKKSPSDGQDRGDFVPPVPPTKVESLVSYTTEPEEPHRSDSLEKLKELENDKYNFHSSDFLFSEDDEGPPLVVPVPVPIPKPRTSWQPDPSMTLGPGAIPWPIEPKPPVPPPRRRTITIAEPLPTPISSGQEDPTPIRRSRLPVPTPSKSGVYLPKHEPSKHAEYPWISLGPIMFPVPMKSSSTRNKSKIKQQKRVQEFCLHFSDNTSSYSDDLTGFVAQEYTREYTAASLNTIVLDRKANKVWYQGLSYKIRDADFVADFSDTTSGD